jgi:hypothetical protein
MAAGMRSYAWEGAIGVGVVEIVIHEAICGGCAGSMTGAAELSWGVCDLTRAKVEAAKRELRLLYVVRSHALAEIVFDRVWE